MIQVSVELAWNLTLLPEAKTLALSCTFLLNVKGFLCDVYDFMRAIELGKEDVCDKIHSLLALLNRTGRLND